MQWGRCCTLGLFAMQWGRCCTLGLFAMQWGRLLPAVSVLHFGARLQLRAARSFDLAALPVDFVECLMRFVPTEAEVKALRQFERERRAPDELSAEDRFMLHFSKVERLPQRMAVMAFLGNFADSLQMLTPVRGGLGCKGASSPGLPAAQCCAVLCAAVRPHRCWASSSSLLCISIIALHHHHCCASPSLLCISITAVHLHHCCASPSLLCISIIIVLHLLPRCFASPFASPSLLCILTIALHPPHALLCIFIMPCFASSSSLLCTPCFASSSCITSCACLVLH
ncbi:uncharacterized protein LOC122190913 [Lagopus leucura]|uniref:uncharacterized protein LOC122190913 n=1 Tax=Lagopus leucura TaxID=30410 RepID=UPI001C6869AC|nr:uncharacterized protein LOC122190913 [Lagopus leucura]